jgi:periplasmic copper chaperone A
VKIRLTILGCALLAGLCLVPAAAGHVTLNPGEAPAESFARFDVRVPTERDVPTTKVSVQLPEGLFFVSFQPKPGWKRVVKMEKLDKPVDLFGDKVTERVASVTWSGGQIKPGEFDEFGMSARMPETAGKSLTFPAVQTYAGGEVVRWIGPEDSEEPAPRVNVTAAEEEEGAAEEPAAQQQAPAAAEDGDDGGSDTLAIIALVLGAAGLVAGLAAFVRSGGGATRPAGRSPQVPT